MPGRRSPSFLRNRGLRISVFVLVLGSAIISAIYVFGGFFGTENAVHPSIDTQLEPDFSKQLENTLQVRDNYVLESEQTSNNVGKRPYNNETVSTCSRIEEFVPNMDARKIYPTLDFDGSWIDDKEFWDYTFEEKYLARKEAMTTNLKVFVVPHSHTDPGWLQTFEEYFNSKTRDIIDNTVDKLEELQLMKFQLSEISFLAKWYKFAHPTRRAALKRLVKAGRLEIATGGWVMTDEAGVNLYSMIDQLVEGHQWVSTHLGVVPKTSWSIDPFGHGSTFPYILNAAGIESMIIQRIHYAWKKYFAENQAGDFNWVQRWDTHREHSILCHNMPFDIYSIKHSCGPSPRICLNFDFRDISGEYSENYYIMRPITRENLKEKAELLLEQYTKAASLFPHNVALVSLGDDFRYNNPVEWNQQYYNYLTLFNYINANKNRYKTDIQFGTISEYFEAVSKKAGSLPTFSGDFFVYSDIFSDGRPAYWSGYFGTRPYWKKFYRETENALRSAEILYSFATALARQQNEEKILLIMNNEYEKLETARQWQALFAHHDAVTGTSKARIMDDYGLKLLEAKQNSMRIQGLAINSILFGETEHSRLSLDYEQATFSTLPMKVPIKLSTTTGEKKVVLFNSLAWKRSHLTKIIVLTPNVQVIGPKGESISSQLNPVMDLNGSFPSISSNIFELTFIVSLPPLTISTFTIKAAPSGTANSATMATVYCRNCTGPRGLFEIKPFQVGNIQLTNDRMQLLFDRNTGLLLGIKKPNENVAVNAKLHFGSYKSFDYRSGAYLLALDTEEPEPIPFSGSVPKIFIISGPISSELSVASEPLLISTQIMHAGGLPFEDGIYIQSTVNLGVVKGEVFMRFDTDMNSTTIARDDTVTGPTPTFYTDQNGFTVEKRTKISKIKLEGNYYPVNTMSYIQDEDRGLRLSILVDRAHGFSSFEKGRLETLIERRTIYDDARGMGEGVTDNRETLSNYVILLEKIQRSPEPDHYESSVPTMAAHHASQSLSYPPSQFVLDYQNFPERFQSSTSFSLFSHEFPCDTHLINLRTMGEDKLFDIEQNLPSNQALMIIQKLGYYCMSAGNGTESCGNGNAKGRSLFYAKTTLNQVSVKKITQTTLTGIDNSTFQRIPSLDTALGNPYEIKSLILSF